MADPHLFLCGELTAADLPRGRRRGAQLHELRIGDGRSDVRLRINQLTATVQAGLPDVAADLVEVAAYVYAADQAVRRGGPREFEYGERWRRTLRFEVPVRRPEVWCRPPVLAELQAALDFLTDDRYEFAFRRAVKPTPSQRYLTDDCPPDGGREYEEVLLFSGGLDSLGGAVEEILAGQRRVALVSHRPVSTVWARQCGLVRAIRAQLPRSDLAPLHVGLEVNKGRALDREFTQRSRSFLFTAAAAVVARQLGRTRVRFYENGVTGLNLPINPQVLGGRASRTTHPQVLARFGRLFTQLFETPFAVENPFQWLTKAEVLQRLEAHGHAKLCAQTSSCASTRTRSQRHPHCGRCSQCVDRRVSVLAAGLSEADDPPGGYESDVLTGERDGAELALVDGYYGTAMDVAAIDTAREFATCYGEINAVLPYAGLPSDQAVEEIYGLHHRHAAGVRRALEQVVAVRSAEVVQQAYPARSLLGVALGRIESRSGGVATERVPGSNGAPQTTQFVVDTARFEVRLGSHTCRLGNTYEFWVLERLARAGDQYVSVNQLRDEVWDDAMIEKNTIQRTISNVRRKLREHQLEEVVLDGTQRDHYRLVLPDTVRVAR